MSNTNNGHGQFQSTRSIAAAARNFTGNSSKDSDGEDDKEHRNGVAGNDNNIVNRLVNSIDEDFVDRFLETVPALPRNDEERQLLSQRRRHWHHNPQHNNNNNEYFCDDNTYASSSPHNFQNGRMVRVNRASMRKRDMMLLIYGMLLGYVLLTLYDYRKNITKNWLSSFYYGDDLSYKASKKINMASTPYYGASSSTSALKYSHDYSDDDISTSSRNGGVRGLFRRKSKETGGSSSTNLGGRYTSPSTGIGGGSYSSSTSRGLYGSKSSGGLYASPSTGIGGASYSSSASSGLYGTKSSGSYSGSMSGNNGDSYSGTNSIRDYSPQRSSSGYGAGSSGNGGGNAYGGTNAYGGGNTYSGSGGGHSNLGAQQLGNIGSPATNTGLYTGSSATNTGLYTGSSATNTGLYTGSSTASNGGFYSTATGSGGGSHMYSGSGGGLYGASASGSRGNGKW